MSKIVIQLLRKSTAMIVMAALVACTGVPAPHPTALKIIDLSSAKLPKVAAEFITVRKSEEQGHEHDKYEPQTDQVTWRFWRDSQQIIIERPQLGMGEQWQRDGKSIIHRKLYHDYQRAIEFQDDDLRILHSVPSWQKLALLLDQQMLAQLSASDLDWSGAYPIREYHGKVAETEWHIVMRMDLGLPVLIERQHKSFSEHTELLQAYPLSAAPFQPTPTNGYDVIDFADLGDKEYDPFVARVLSQIGHDHHH